jgi:hypothetical protein
MEFLVPTSCGSLGGGAGFAVLELERAAILRYTRADDYLYVVLASDIPVACSSRSSNLVPHHTSSDSEL